MRLTAVPARGALPALLLAALLLIPAARGAAETPEEYILAITANNHPLYPVHTDEPPVEDPTGTFEEGVRELRAEHPRAFFAEAGHFASFGAVLETAYNSRSLNFFDQLDYHAVHLGARDAAFTTIGTTGLHYSPDSIKNRIVTNVHTTTPDPLDIPPLRKAANDDGQEAIFLNLASMRTAQGLGERLALLKPDEWEDIRERLREAARDHTGPVIAAGSLTNEEWEEFFSANTRPPVHIYLDFSLPADSEPALRDGVWRVPVPRMGHVHLVGFRFREEEVVEQPTLERLDLLPGIEPEDLVKYPTPRIGLPITNLDSVMRQFFSVSADAVRQDRMEADGIEELTSVARPMVYHLEDEEGPKRLYRVMSIMPHSQRPGLLAVGWPETHAIFVLTEDHELDRIVSRFRFPIGGLDTTLLEALNRLPGTPQDEWAPDPELAAGVEAAWRWVVDDIRRTIELDKRLYGKDGPYYIPPDED